MARFNEEKLEAAKRQMAGGDEPIDWFNSPLTDPKDPQWSRYYNWINYNFNYVEQHKFILEYMKYAGYDSDDIERIKVLGPNDFTWAVSSAIARLLTQDIKVPTPQINFMKSRLNMALAKVQDVPIVREKTKISVQDRIRLQAMEKIGGIEGAIDDFNFTGKSNFSIFNYLTENKIDKHYIIHIQRHYAKQFNEMMDAYAGLDSFAEECYAPVGNDKLKDRMLFVKGLIEGAGEYAKGIKITRKRRTKNKRKIRKSRTS